MGGQCLGGGGGGGGAPPPSSSSRFLAPAPPAALFAPRTRLGGPCASVWGAGNMSSEVASSALVPTLAQALLPPSFSRPPCSRCAFRPPRFPRRCTPRPTAPRGWAAWARPSPPAMRRASSTPCAPSTTHVPKTRGSWPARLKRPPEPGPEKMSRGGLWRF